MIGSDQDVSANHGAAWVVARTRLATFAAAAAAAASAATETRTAATDMELSSVPAAPANF